MDVIAKYADTCRVATAHDAVHKDECCYTFWTDNLLVHLTHWTATTPALAARHLSRPALFLRIVRQETEKKPQADAVAPTQLALGVPGGFDGGDTTETTFTYTVVVLAPDGTVLAEVPYDTTDTSSPPPSFPTVVQQSVESVIQHAGVALQTEVQAWQHDEEIPVSKYANAELPFVDNGVKIDPNPSTWKCETSGATENLWLNLSDGFIGGGRKNWDVRCVVWPAVLGLCTSGRIVVNAFVLKNISPCCFVIHSRFCLTGIRRIQWGIGSLRSHGETLSIGGQIGDTHGGSRYRRLLFLCGRRGWPRKDTQPRRVARETGHSIGEYAKDGQVDGRVGSGIECHVCL